MPVAGPILGDDVALEPNTFDIDIGGGGDCGGDDCGGGEIGGALTGGEDHSPSGLAEPAGHPAGGGEARGGSSPCGRTPIGIPYLSTPRNDWGGDAARGAAGPAGRGLARAMPSSVASIECSVTDGAGDSAGRLARESANSGRDKSPCSGPPGPTCSDRCGSTSPPRAAPPNAVGFDVSEPVGCRAGGSGDASYEELGGIGWAGVGVDVGVVDACFGVGVEDVVRVGGTISVDVEVPAGEVRVADAASTPAGGCEPDAGGVCGPTCNGNIAVEGGIVGLAGGGGALAGASADSSRDAACDRAIGPAGARDGRGAGGGRGTGGGRGAARGGSDWEGAACGGATREGAERGGAGRGGEGRGTGSALRTPSPPRAGGLVTADRGGGAGGAAEPFGRTIVVGTTKGLPHCVHGNVCPA